MRGLTDEEYLNLIYLAQDAGKFRDISNNESAFELNERLYVQRRVSKYMYEEDDEIWDAWTITPMGLLAIKLWPSNRVTTC